MVLSAMSFGFPILYKHVSSIEYCNVQETIDKLNRSSEMDDRS